MAEKFRVISTKNSPSKVIDVETNQTYEGESLEKLLNRQDYIIMVKQRYIEQLEDKLTRLEFNKALYQKKKD